jgi:2-phospho-L-lactate/phosphoenolpyruvate guanylyltransferase
MILIPVKNLAAAKQRLATILDQETRTALAQAMLHDVLEEISRWRERPEVGLVTSDAFAIDLARQYDFQIMVDQVNAGETAAIEIATHHCVALGVEYSLVIPGDIPLMQAAELQSIVQAAPSAGSVLVPAADGRGTNAAFRRPAGLFPLRFGNDSFKPHLSAARATQKPCVIISQPGIALDVDTPADLKDLVAARGNMRAQRMARQWDLADLPLAASE